MNWSEYHKQDKPSKNWFVEIVHKNSKFRVIEGLNEELYKGGDLIFQHNNKKFSVELEVRDAFDDIVQKYQTIHISIRKKDTPADFYVVLKPDFQQFILIKNKIIKKHMNNVVNVLCNHEKNSDGSYYEDFLDIKKENTQWYVVGPNHKPIKVNY